MKIALKTKDIRDVDVCVAQALYELVGSEKDPIEWPYDYLMRMTGASQKVCYRAMERCDRRGLLDYGVSLRTAWLTISGLALIDEPLRQAYIKKCNRPLKRPSFGSNADVLFGLDEVDVAANAALMQIARAEELALLMGR